MQLARLQTYTMVSGRGFHCMALDSLESPGRSSRPGAGTIHDAVPGCSSLSPTRHARTASVPVAGSLTAGPQSRPSSWINSLWKPHAPAVPPKDASGAGSTVEDSATKTNRAARGGIAGRHSRTRSLVATASWKFRSYSATTARATPQSPTRKTAAPPARPVHPTALPDLGE